MPRRVRRPFSTGSGIGRDNPVSRRLTVDRMRWVVYRDPPAASPSSRAEYGVSTAPLAADARYRQHGKRAMDPLRPGPGLRPRIHPLVPLHSRQRFTARGADPPRRGRLARRNREDPAEIVAQPGPTINGAARAGARRLVRTRVFPRSLELEVRPPRRRRRVLRGTTCPSRQSRWCRPTTTREQRSRASSFLSSAARGAP